jgi:flagellin-like protein
MYKRSDFNKKGVSAVVATVLIIMITVAAVGLVWAVVIPMIKDNLGVSSSCKDIDISIDTSGGYTCYDSAQKIVSVQVKRGSGEVGVRGVNFLLSSGGNSYSENLSYNFAQNEYHTFYVSAKTLGAIDGVSLAPVSSTGKVCGSISLASSLSNCVNLGTVETINDEYYPQFSGYSSNTNSFLDIGTGIFNVTVLNTNGTVYLEINGTNILAIGNNNVYSVSTPISSAGTYSYKWYSFGNGTAKNYNVSGDNNYAVGSAFAGGKGTTGEPFQITSWTQLNSVRTRLDKNFILTTNLNSSTVNYSEIGDNWNPIGSSASGYQFSGNFNGSGKTISNLSINKVGVDNIGLFGYLIGTISNTGLINVNVTGGSRAGGLAGYSAGTITNSYATGNVNGSSRVGGLVGSSAGTITNSYATGNVNGSGFVGGLIGQQSNGATYNSYATGNVNGSGSIAGGLIGHNVGTISNSYATGNVTGGGSWIGGLVGFMFQSYPTGTITNSYATGKVTGSSSVGGVVGIFNGQASNSYWNINTSGNNLMCGNGDGSFGCITANGLTTAQMKNPDTFSFWDASIWNLTQGEYPQLKWQN